MRNNILYNISNLSKYSAVLFAFRVRVGEGVGFTEDGAKFDKKLCLRKYNFIIQ